jgi:hypothetical protein
MEIVAQDVEERCPWGGVDLMGTTVDGDLQRGNHGS